jgi:2',3'-cyclic-nucleotide 2'-phosphodiesterase/3'-nucleotidase
VKTIREKEHPDLMVGLFHSGWEPQEQNLPEDAPLGRENSTKWIAQNVPGLDLIFFGHDHQAKAEKVTNINGDTVYVLNSGTRGANLAQADVTLRRHGKPIIKIGLIPTLEQEIDPDFMAMLQPYLDRAEAFQSEEVAMLPVAISPNEVFEGSCLWVDEIHRCQLDAAEANGMAADISLAAPLTRRYDLEPGILTVADFFKWYPFENSLAVMEMTGRDVRAHLEYAYEIRNTIYNFDSAAGIIYQIEKDKPYGERVSIVSMADGTPFDLDKVYRVVLNSYRSMGGGNHFVNGCGWAQDDIASHRLWNSDEDLRTLFIEWARAKGTLDVEPLNNWTIK